MYKKIKEFPDYFVTDSGNVYSCNYNHTGKIKKMKGDNEKDILGFCFIKEIRFIRNLSIVLWQKHLYLTQKINRK